MTATTPASRAPSAAPLARAARAAVLAASVGAPILATAHDAVAPTGAGIWLRTGRAG